MRLRNIKGSRETIAASRYIIKEESERGASFLERHDWSVKGRWAEIFGNGNPVRIEVGMGKGAFLMKQAQLNPDINFVGIEKFSSVMLRAVQKQDELRLPNVRLIRMDAENLPDVFAPEEVDRLYLNFSDPWPKKGQASKRLTSHRFLERYEHILKKGGLVEFKTDNQALFDFSLEEIPVRNEIARAAAWELLAVTRDLHADAVMNEGNVMTEYEQRFSALGNPICKYVARYNAGPVSHILR